MRNFFMLSKKLTKELYQILSEDYQINLSQAEVLETGKSLVGFFETLISAQKQQITIKNNKHE